MKPFTAIIIEDEKPAARLLGKMLHQLRPQWQVETLPGSVEDAIAWLSVHEHPRLIFLDIHLTDGEAFELVERARPNSAIIFTTAYEEFALRAFEVNGIGYLLKPFNEQQLEAALMKYETLTSIAENKGGEEYIENVLACLQSKEKTYRTRFLIEGSTSFHTMPVDDVAYFRSENKITYAVPKKGRPCVIDLPLDKLGEQLDPDRFFRINRQYLVAVEAIRKVEPYFGGKLAVVLVPQTEQTVTVSKEKACLFKLWLGY